MLVFFSYLWCPEPDSNRHSAFAPRDFKSESPFARQFHVDDNEANSEGFTAGVCASVLLAFGSLGTVTGTVWAHWP